MAYTRIGTANYSGGSGCYLFTEYQVLSQDTSTGVSNVRFQIVSYSPGVSSYDNAPSGSSLWMWNSSYGYLVNLSNPTFDFRSAGFTVWGTVDRTFQHDSNGNCSTVIRGFHQPDPSLTIGAADTGDVTFSLPKINMNRVSSLTSGVGSFYVTDDLSKGYHQRITYTSTTYSSIKEIGVLPSYGNAINRMDGINRNGGTYDLVLTDAEKEKVYTLTNSSTQVNFRLNWCTYSGSTQVYIDYRDNYIKVNSTYDSPKNMAVGVADTNSTTLNLTKSSSTLINGYSDATVTVSTKPIYTHDGTTVIDNKATIESYKFSCDDGSATIAESDSTISKTFSGVKSSSFTVLATDSRAFTCSVTATATLLDYTTVAVRNIATDRALTSVTVTITGGCYYGKFSTASNAVSNSIKTVSYYYKESGTDIWTTGTGTLSRSLSSSGTFTCSGTLPETFAENITYDFKVSVSDELSTSEVTTVINQLQPALKIKGSNLRLSTENTYLETPTGTVTPLLDALYPVGSIYISVENVNPSSFIGGSWSAITDRFLVGNGDKFTAGVSGGTTSYALRACIGAVNDDVGSLGYWPTGSVGGSSTYQTNYKIGGSTSTVTKINHSTVVCDGNQGRSTAVSIKPPYLCVYMWKRTS